MCVCERAFYFHALARRSFPLATAQSELHLGVLNSFSLTESSHQIERLRGARPLSPNIYYTSESEWVTALKKRHFRPTRNRRIKGERRAKGGYYILFGVQAHDKIIYSHCARERSARRSRSGKKERMAILKRCKLPTKPFSKLLLLSCTHWPMSTETTPFAAYARASQRDRHTEKERNTIFLLFLWRGRRRRRNARVRVSLFRQKQKAGAFISENKKAG